MSYIPQSPSLSLNLSCMNVSQVHDIKFDFLLSVRFLSIWLFGQPKEPEERKETLSLPLMSLLKMRHLVSLLFRTYGQVSSSLHHLPKLICCSPTRSCSSNHICYSFFMGAFFPQLLGVCVQVSPLRSLSWAPSWTLQARCSAPVMARPNVSPSFIFPPETVHYLAYPIFYLFICFCFCFVRLGSMGAEFLTFVLYWGQ